MGGATALVDAIDHPEIVRRLIVVSAGSPRTASTPRYGEVAGHIGRGLQGAGDGAGQKEPRRRFDPSAVFIVRVRAFMMAFKGWPESDVRGIKAPTLLGHRPTPT